MGRRLRKCGLFGVFFCGFAALSLDDEVVVDAEGSGSRVGLHACDGFIPVVVDDTVESHIAVFYDDMDGVESDGRIIGDASSHRATSAARPESLADSALVGVVFAQ